MSDTSNHATPAERRALRAQGALREMLMQQTHSHWVTLNFHAAYKKEVSEKKLRLWTMNIASRLFGHTDFAGVPVSELLSFTAMPEFSLRGDPHFHLLLRVDPRRADYFERIAAKLWKNIVPTGSADIQQLIQTEGDYARVIWYATKLSHLPRFNAYFVEPGMLELPAY